LFLKAEKPAQQIDSRAVADVTHARTAENIDSVNYFRTCYTQDRPARSVSISCSQDSENQ